ncbi:MAG TPA: hypothetical protein EYO33_00380, partial [Phycisphaerales bacterium]|nr:hypothetical protein [Phycisphaerales bacterium]
MRVLHDHRHNTVPSEQMRRQTRRCNEILDPGTQFAELIDALALRIVIVFNQPFECTPRIDRPDRDCRHRELCEQCRVILVVIASDETRHGGR